MAADERHDEHLLLTAELCELGKLETSFDRHVAIRETDALDHFPNREQMPTGSTKRTPRRRSRQKIDEL